MVSSREKREGRLQGLEKWEEVAAAGGEPGGESRHGAHQHFAQTLGRGPDGGEGPAPFCLLLSEVLCLFSVWLVCFLREKEVCNYFVQSSVCVCEYKEEIL